MKKLFIVMLALLFLLVSVLFQEPASARTKIIIGPWWPVPLVIFPAVPPPPLFGPGPPPHPIRTGFLSIDIRPPDAEIFVDGEFKGLARDFTISPPYLELLGGEHKIALKKKGFATLSFLVHVIPGEFLTIDVTLDPVMEDTRDHDRTYKLDIEKTGYIFFDITPPDSAVYIDGNFYGVASNLRDVSGSLLLREGKHHIEVIRPGYAAYESEIVLVSNEKKKIMIKLERKE